MIVYVYLCCFLLFLYFLEKRNRNHWKSRGVPFETPFLFFGNIYSVVTGKEHFSERVRTIYNAHKSPYVGIHVFNKPFLMLRSPDLIKKVMVKDSHKFLNRNLAADERADPISYHSLFSAKDSAWKSSRTQLSPVFTSGKLKLMFPLIKECSLNLKDYLERNIDKTVFMREMNKKYTVDVISSCAFGIDAYCLKNEDSEILKIATQLFSFNSVKRNLISFCFFFIPAFVSLFKLKLLDKTASDYLWNVLKVTAKERKDKKIVRNDLIDLMSKCDFDDAKTASHALLFFTAGNDTTATMMTFTLYELAVHKDIQDRLREELRRSFEENGDFTYESVQELKYLDMVFNEALRLYPLTTFLDRVSMDTYTFEETGLTLDKGTAVMVPLCGLHFDPEYFPEPRKFDPERFSEENRKNIKPYTFMPFGEGPRICIGQRFAHLTAKIGLAYAIKDYAFEPVESTDILVKLEQSTTFLQSKTGIPLKVLKM